MHAWYLVYSKPRQERVALENLERQGYRTYLPIVRGRKPQRGRYADVLQPLFPRYLFVNLSDETDDWSPIRSTLGVVNLVRFGKVAARVPDALIDALRAREDEHGVLAWPGAPLHHGDRVRIVDGVLAGYEAIFQARTGRERVVLLLDVAGRAANVEVDASHVEAARSEDWSRA